MTAVGRLLLALALPAPGLVAGPVDPLAVCDAQVAAHPQEADSYRCYNRESRRHGNLWAELVSFRLRASAIRRATRVGTP